MSRLAESSGPRLWLGCRPPAEFGRAGESDPGIRFAARSTQPLGSRRQYRRGLAGAQTRAGRAIVPSAAVHGCRTLQAFGPAALGLRSRWVRTDLRGLFRAA